MAPPQALGADDGRPVHLHGSLQPPAARPPLQRPDACQAAMVAPDGRPAPNGRLEPQGRTALLLEAAALGACAPRGLEGEGGLALLFDVGPRTIAPPDPLCGHGGHHELRQARPRLLAPDPRLHDRGGGAQLDIAAAGRGHAPSGLDAEDRPCLLLQLPPHRVPAPGGLESRRRRRLLGPQPRD